MRVEDIKKVELHIHLDGSVRPSTLSELKGISISEAEKLLIASYKCLDLNEYLTKFNESVKIMQTESNLIRIAREVAMDIKNDNCVYAEIRFAPNKHTSILSLDEVVEAVLEGLKQVDLKTNLILCMMRGDSDEDNKKIIDLAYKYLNKGVCAIDLAGSESLYKTANYEELFNYAKSKNVPYTIHAGEADGVDSVISAINTGTTRIGHGVRAIEDDKCLELIKRKNILLEVCPTSNIQTNIYESINDHPIKELFDKNVMVSINTDNRTVSNVTLNDEYRKLVQAFNFTEYDFIKMNIDAINHAFLSEEEKGELIKLIEE